MTQKQNLKILLTAALVTCALGGFGLHFRIHPVSKSTVFFIPFISGVVSIVFIPLLFQFKNTIQYGYVLNGIISIIGTIVMTHLSISHPPESLTFRSILFETMLANILLLFGKFFIGKTFFDLVTFGAEASEHKGVWYRYPNMGWWGVHLIAISIVYTLGNIIWRHI